MLKIDKDESRFWRNDEGNPHREDGPAFELKNGNKYWYVNGSRHRIDGPAVEDKNGDREWFVIGKRHRINGPAVERRSGYKEYFLDGKYYSEEEYRERVRELC